MVGNRGELVQVVRGEGGKRGAPELGAGLWGPSPLPLGGRVMYCAVGQGRTVKALQRAAIRAIVFVCFAHVIHLGRGTARRCRAPSARGPAFYLPVVIVAPRSPAPASGQSTTNRVSQDRGPAP